MGTAGVILTPGIIKSMSVENSNPRLIKPGAELIRSAYEWDQDEIFIRVTNTNQEPVDVMLFGVKKNITGNFIPDGVKIAVSGSSYKQLMSAILYQPIRILGFKMRMQHPQQIYNSLILIHEDENAGKMNMLRFTPSNYLSATAINATMIDYPSFELILTPEVYILTKVNANEQVDYRFTIADNDNLKIFK